MTGYAASFKKGRVRAGEVDYLFTPTKGRGATKYGVILCHGKGVPWGYIGGASNSIAWASAEIPARLARAGIPSVGAAMSGDSFANDASMLDMTAAKALLAQAGCSVTKVHLFGISMGGAVSLRWAGQNPNAVASITGLLPTTDVKTIYDNDQAGLRAAAGTAWGVNYPAAFPAGGNLPANSYPAIVGAHIPYRGYYSDNDAVIPKAQVIAAAAALGGEAIKADQAYGHTEYAVKSFNDGFMDSYIDWIKGLGA